MIDKHEERVMWFCAALGALIIGITIGQNTKDEDKPESDGLIARLESLEKRAEEQERRRCLSDKPEFTVYMVPNLGVHKVAKP